jgi:hypothetical protein
MAHFLILMNLSTDISHIPAFQGAHSAAYCLQFCKLYWLRRHVKQQKDFRWKAAKTDRDTLHGTKQQKPRAKVGGGTFVVDKIVFFYRVNFENQAVSQRR